MCETSEQTDQHNDAHKYEDFYATEIEQQSKSISGIYTLLESVLCSTRTPEVARGSG